MKCYEVHRAFHFVDYIQHSPVVAFTILNKLPQLFCRYSNDRGYTNYEEVFPKGKKMETMKRLIKPDLGCLCIPKIGIKP